MNALIEKETARTPAKTGGSGQYLLPLANIFETKDAYVVEAEMPGVKREGLDLSLDGHTLTLVGHRQANPPPADALYVESKEADFRRVFELEPAIESSKISARLEHGLLTVLLPKAERVQPRKIAVGD